jgi:hypothetical protein
MRNRQLFRFMAISSCWTAAGTLWRSGAAQVLFDAPLYRPCSVGPAAPHQQNLQQLDRRRAQHCMCWIL